jgi:hypothetical protein
MGIGKLKSVREGGRRYVRQSEVDAILAKRVSDA